MAEGLSEKASFLYNAVLKPQPDAEKARRFFPTLRKWAETGKEYRGTVFTFAEVEEAIAAFERSAIPRNVPSPQQQKTEWWPRWALNKASGVEVLAPLKGKPTWTHATPVALGYHGQKKCFLFVRSESFEMDCRRSEVRPVGSNRTAQQQMDDLISRGHRPEDNQDWTDGSDVNMSDEVSIDFIRPGVPERSKSGSSGAQASGDADIVNALENEFERMTLLRRSTVVKSSTCDHPDPLSEPRAAASIRLPELTEEDALALPALVAQGRLSSLQLETVCFAARRFRTQLPDGRTAGYVLGDGTGCGKGRVISALLYHMWNSGHRRSIWVSATSDLYYDACRDLQDLGADIPCMPMRKLPPSGSLDKKGTSANKELIRHLGIEGDGVIFLTYSLLVQTGQRREVFPCTLNSQEGKAKLVDALDEKLRCTTAVHNFGIDGTGRQAKLRAGDRIVSVKNFKELQALELPVTLSIERVLDKKKPSKDGDEDADGKDDTGELNPWNSRLGQLVEWLGGAKASGLICFDEVHKAKNLVPDKPDQASTKTGLYVDRLQQFCPKAPVLYVSATAATEVQHLGYMSRLGVWGPGSVFDTFGDFQKVIESNGVAAMEMFAMNMKAIGAMSCRALAYVGTEFQLQQNGMAEDQYRVYDTAANFWQKLLEMFCKFIHSKDLKETYRNYFFRKLLQKQAEKGKAPSRKNSKELADDEEDDIVTKRLWQFYWGAQQRFFKAICNSAKVPAACVAAQEAVERGEQVVISIWATGEARSKARMDKLKEATAGRITVDSVNDGITEIDIKEKGTLASVQSCLYANLALKSKLSIGGKQVAQLSRLVFADGNRISRAEDLLKCSVPCKLIFRTSSVRRLVVNAFATESKEPVSLELADDDLGERVVVSKVIEGPTSVRRAELEGWHVKKINDKPVGKIRVAMIRQRLKKGTTLSFQDPVLDDHLSGPGMIVEHFISSCFLTTGEDGQEVPWANETKSQLLKEAKDLNLPPNAMDDLIDRLGGLKKVAEMSGRSHRIKRRKDGSLAWVARCEELRCPSDGANMVEQGLFQKGTKKICVVTEVASAGISLHADRRQATAEFQPPRRLMISLELPWGADKAIQCFGRVHRANQLVPPKFLVLTTPLGGEVRFNSAIARRMKLLGAVTKGDRMTSMGGVADQPMNDFDVNNMYGQKALATFYTDTAKTMAAAPELLALYEALPFIGAKGDGEASGRWPTWQDFAEEVCDVWSKTRLGQEIECLLMESQDRSWAAMGTKESGEINRFFNRILMLEVDLQNAVFETFFAVYTELVRVDKANGEFDEGIENLNRVQGRLVQGIQVDTQELLHKDPRSGAETSYVRLSLDRGISWEAAKAAYDEMSKTERGSMEGFYEYRQSPASDPIYVLAKEMIQLGGAGATGTTWIARRRQRQFAIWRADSGADTGRSFGRQAYFEADLRGERFSRIYGSEEDLEMVKAGWTDLYDKTVDQRTVKEHLLTGDVLTAWQLVNGSRRANKIAEDSQSTGTKLQTVRAITQPHGVPVVGMRVEEKDLPQLKYVLSCQQATAQNEQSEKREAVNVREASVCVADRLMQHLWTLEGWTMPYKSWLEVHKMVSSEDDMTSLRSIAGLRGTQTAVEKLQRSKLIKIEEGQIALCPRAGGKPLKTEADLLKPLDPPPTRQELETLFYQVPERTRSQRNDREESEDFTDDSSSEEEEEEEADTFASAKSSRTPDVKVSKEARSEKTSDKKRKMEERPEKSSGGKRGPATGRVSKRKAMEQALFGDDDDADFWENLESQGDSLPLEDSQPKEESETKKRERDAEMRGILFGDLNEDSDTEQNQAKKSKSSDGAQSSQGTEQPDSYPEESQEVMKE